MEREFLNFLSLCSIDGWKNSVKSSNLQWDLILLEGQKGKTGQFIAEGERWERVNPVQVKKEKKIMHMKIYCLGWNRSGLNILFFLVYCSLWKPQISYFVCVAFAVYNWSLPMPINLAVS